MNDTSSLKQAAVILKSLPRAQAAVILSRLEAADIQTVLDTINTLDRVTADEISSSLDRLNRESRRWKTGAERDVNALLVDSDEIEGGIQDRRSSLTVDPAHPFAFLVDTLPMVRDHLLQDEHPKNVAIVLSMLPPDVASLCMNSFEPNTRVSVLRRMCELDEVNQEEVMQLSYALKLRHKKITNNRAHQNKGVDSAAELLSCSDQETQDRLLAHINQSDPDLADKLQRSVFKIEDVEFLSDEEVKVLLRNVDTSCWAPALKAAPLSLQSKILGNLAEKPAAILNREIDDSGSVDEHTQSLARRQIINGVLTLNKQGKINLGKGSAKGSVFPKVEYGQSASTMSTIN
jgi:flagellar motor switch protein FliG